MKIIDLLNKIANGEEVPKKIKYDNLVYEYNEQYDYKNELQINYYSVDNGTDFFNNVFCYSLNDEVEIIEEEKKSLNDIRESYGLPRIEEKKIPEKINEDIDYIDFNIKLFPTTSSTKFNYKEKVIINKINEIIDYLKSKGE